MRARAGCAAALALALGSVSCAKDTQVAASVEAGAAMAGDGGLGNTALAPCLDRPTDLPRPPRPSGKLPCDLLPPGFGSEKP